MSVAHFKVASTSTRAFNGTNQARVTIDRRLGLFTVRPHKRRKTYELPLADVAEMALWRVMKFDLAEKKKAKAAARKAGR